MKTMSIQDRTMLKSKKSLKAAASATFKCSPMTAQQTTMGGYAPADQTLVGRVPKQIETIWDEPTVFKEATAKLNSCSNTVNRMQGVFEGVTRMKEGKRQMLDEMHEHTLGNIQDLRQYTLQLLRALGDQIGTFCSDWEQTRVQTTDALDVEMRDRLVALTKRYDALEARANALAIAIDKETQERIRHISDVLVPSRAQVEQLTEELATEHRIRESRNIELRDHLESVVRYLEESLEAERKNRIERHLEAMMSSLGEVGCPGDARAVAVFRFDAPPAPTAAPTEGDEAEGLDREAFSQDLLNQLRRLGVPEAAASALEVLLPESLPEPGEDGRSSPLVVDVTGEKSAIAEMRATVHGRSVTVLGRKGVLRKGMESDFSRLRRRCGEMTRNDDETLAQFSQDLDDERAHRVQSQDHIAEEINNFIHRFQKHMIEEAHNGD
mmetsp:Transcript_13726/g.37079  ORF Transcript_13726/g.37079 Transcript_13726/m.37079 type:complete len:439 (-) Transcript_13726:163-1479(-)